MMPDDPRKDDGEKLDKLLKGIDAVCAKMDAMEKRVDSMEAEAKDRKDAEEKAKADAAEAEKKAEEEKKDKKDGEEEGEPEPVAADKKDRKDSEKAESEEKAYKKDAKKDGEDEDEKKAAADAALAKENADLKARLDAIEAKLPKALTDADREAFSGAQAKADAVYAQHGMTAPRPLDGETVDAYRVRLLRPMQKHSAMFKDANLDVARVDSAMLTPVETQIFADAVRAARDPSTVAVGTLRERHGTTHAGHKFIDFDGQPRAWMNAFMPTGNVAKITPPTAVRH
jgi:hypothetical protein